MMIAVAILLFTSAVPLNFDALAKGAARARAENRIPEAIRLYQRAVELRPQWAEGWWYSAALLYDQDQHADAAAAFSRFLKLDPKSGPGWTMLGLCESRLKKYDDALQHLLLGKALGLPDVNPISEAARYRRAILQTHFGNHELALDELKQFAFASAETPAVIRAIGVAALHLDFLPDELPADRTDIVMKTGRAVYDSWAARGADAAREFQELVLTYPDNASIRYLYGAFLFESDRDAALRQLGKCLELDPNYVPAMLQIAFERLSRGEPEEGIRYARNAVRLEPASFVAHNALGRLLIAAGDVQTGITELEKAVSLAPDNAECRFALASAYTKANRKQDAAREQAAFVRLQQDHPRRAGAAGSAAVHGQH